MYTTTMFRILIFATLLIAFSATAMAEKRIVFLGDSLTAGYGLDPAEAFTAVIADRLEQEGLDVEVINAGISGDTTAGGLRRMSWLLRRPMDVLVLSLGANDALRGLDLEGTEKNLADIILAARKANPEVEIVLGGMLAPPNMGKEYADHFAGLFPRLAEKYSVHLVPFLLEGVAGEPSLNLADGIHPNVEGQKRVATNVLEVLRPLLGERESN